MIFFLLELKIYKGTVIKYAIRRRNNKNIERGKVLVELNEERRGICTI